VSIKPPSSNIRQTSLIKQGDTHPNFPGLELVGDRMCPAMCDLLAQFGCPDSAVQHSPPQLTDFGSWKADQPKFLVALRVQLRPLKGSMAVIIPAAAVMRLVDLFYGGSGDLAESRDAFTAAECQFLTRIGDQFVSVLQNAWSPVRPMEGTLAGIETSAATLSLGKARDLVAIQRFSITSGPLKGQEFESAYRVAALRGIPELSVQDDPDEDNAIDPKWRARMIEAVMQARLPLRTIFARPELPLSQLLTLQPGEIIPICLPRSIPITVAGRQFAVATIGESNGRAAICLEKLEEGSLPNE
jgi:flagellar motor switch protein FliM